MVGNEFSVGSTLFLDDEKRWSLSGNFALEFHTDKRGTDINVGDMATVQGGLGKTYYHKVDGPIPMIMNLGVDYYAQFKVTGDSGSDIPPALLGFKDRVFGLGPEFNVFLPKPRLTFLVRYEPEFAARVRSAGPDHRLHHRVGGEVAGEDAASSVATTTVKINPHGIGAS